LLQARSDRNVGIVDAIVSEIFDTRKAANVVVFLSSTESSYMTGQAINVTGGQEMR
jgi:NAD(P)-dependent dehydrogenase (short-subunit alcohol dehydrogenase family)